MEQIFDIVYIDDKTGNVVIHDSTTDEGIAISAKNELRKQGKTQPHIQYAIGKRGMIIPEAELHTWAENISETNLLRWNGYNSQKDYEREMDKPFLVRDFIKENQQDLSYIYLNPSKYGLDRDPVYMKEGGAVMETKSKKTDNAQIGFRPLFLDTAILYGRAIEISMPNGEKRKAQFAIVEADNILASHNEINFSSTVGYPTIDGENVNDRNYKDDKNAQLKVIEVAQNLDPNILVSSSRTPAGTPIITKDGIVVSGNNRTMSIKLAIDQYPEQYKEYKSFMASEAFVFGFDQHVGTALLMNDSIPLPGSSFNNSLSVKFKHPVLVRFDYDFPAYNTLELSKYNKETKKSERPIDKAVKISKSLAQSPYRSVIMNLVGEYETFTQFYANYADQKKLRDILTDANIISQNDFSQYFDERGFNEAGKDIIENVLAGLILNIDALIAGSLPGGKQFKNIIITSLPVLAKNGALNPEFSLVPTINEAFLLEKKMHDTGLGFADYIVQGSMFDEPAKKDVLIMNRLLASGRNKFKSSIDAYNQSVIDNENASLFGDKPTVQEIFDTHIKNKIDPLDLKQIERTATVEQKIDLSPEKEEDIDPTWDPETGRQFKKLFQQYADQLQEKFKIKSYSFDDLMLYIVFNDGAGYLHLSRNASIENYSGPNTFDKLQDVEYFLRNMLGHTNEEIEAQFTSPSKQWITKPRAAKAKVENRESTSFANVKEGEHVEVHGYNTEAGKVTKIDEGKVTFKYGNHYLQLDGDSKRKYTYSNTYFVTEPLKKEIKTPLVKNLLPELQSKFAKAIKEFGITEIFIDPQRELHISSDYDIPQDYYQSIEKEVMPTATTQPEWLFIGRYPTGEQYSDKRFSKNGDYVHIAFVFDEIQTDRKWSGAEYLDSAAYRVKVENDKKPEYKKIIADLQKQYDPAQKDKPMEITTTETKIPVKIVAEIKAAIEAGYNNVITSPVDQTKCLLTNDSSDVSGKYDISLKAAIEKLVAETMGFPVEQPNELMGRLKKELLDQAKQKLANAERLLAKPSFMRDIKGVEEVAERARKEIKELERKVPAEQKEVWQMDFNEFISKVLLFNNTFGKDKKVDVSIEKIGGATEVLFSVENTDSEDKGNEYLRLQIEKWHYNKVIEAIKDKKDVPESVIKFYQTEDSLINSNYGVTSLNKVLTQTPALPANTTKESALKMLISDNWYKENPNKVLGTPFQASGRFGPVTKYKGKIEDVNRIDAPLDFMQINAAEKPLMSSENESVQELLIDPQSIQNIEKSIAGTKEETVLRTIKKKKQATTRIVSTNALVNADMVSFEEVYAANNPDISIDELRVYVWYKEQTGLRLSDKWYQLAGGVYLNDYKNDWITNGLLCYFRGELVPSYLYYSGNIWEKKSALENDKSEIIDLYGKVVYEMQKDRLDNVFKVSYDKRLTLTNANFDNRLKLLPISKFANGFMINTLTDGKEFRFKAQAGANAKAPGRPDFLYYGWVGDYEKKTYAELSLTEAFQYWLVENVSAYELKKETTYADIIKIYIQQANKPPVSRNATEADKKTAEAIWQRKVNVTKEEGDRLFSVFLAEWLNIEDVLRIETGWNEIYNGFLPINTNKVPVAFSHAREYRGQIVDIRPEKREAVAWAMEQGTEGIAYDVGVGKTWSALFAIKQFLDAGYCKRPVIVVPNQVYKQFLSEGKGLFPDTKFNDIYNLSADYMEELKAADGSIEPVAERSVSILTYEGFEQIGFNESTAKDILFELGNILDQDPDAAPDFSAKGLKKQSAIHERLQSLIGRGLRGTRINIEDLGFDFGCWDEAHKMKKLFVAVKGEMKKGGEEREKSPYQIQSGGAPSSIALKGFMISRYMLKKNNNRNLLILTATPFTNSPLEIFSCLVFLAYDELKKMDLHNLKSFFDTFVHATNELIINSKLRPERKQVVLGFNNLQSLQQLITRFINYKTGEMVRVKRPQKYVLPYKAKVVNGETIMLSPDEMIDTLLPMTPQQTLMMNNIRAYAEGKVDLASICSVNSVGDVAATNDDEISIDTTVGVELDENSLSANEKAGVRTLRAMSHARNLALSPYLYECSGLGTPTYKEYVETSPKIKFTVESIRSVKKHHESKGTPVCGQIIYMDRGIEYFDLIKQYLVKEVGYKPHEVGIIKSAMSGGREAKEKIKNLFNGEQYQPETGEFIDIPDDERVKIIIGSSTIKEGMNLQKHTAVMYDLFLDWNPTDIKQFEGRGWRQGNLFGSIRIVYPLLMDSMDIFIFQKLEEKTSRIAEIWDTTGETNTFNLQEFNPSEIKAALISDPMILAELQLMEDKEKIEDEIRGVKNEDDTIARIQKAHETYHDNMNDLEEWVNEYRPSKEKRAFSTLVKLATNIVQTQIDADGLKMEYPNHQDKKLKYSEREPAEKPYYFYDMVSANKILLKAEKEFLKPRFLTISKLPAYKKTLEEKLLKLNQVKEETTSEAAIVARAEYIAADRAARKVKILTVAERVKQFATLNYLLDDKQVKSKKVDTVAMHCPPVDENGKIRIDKDAIEHLTACIAVLPQTKELFVDKNGVYTEERQKIHKKIIDSFTNDVTCIKQEKPVAILTGGAPGSGKSHFLKNYAPYLLSNDIFHIDADEVRSMLPEYHGWNAATTHFETKDIVDEMINDIGGSCKYDLVYDGTMNKAKKYYELIKKLKSVGYDVFIIYIDVPQEVSEKRVLERYQRTGRFVPMDVVQEVFDAGHEAFDQIKTMVSGWIQVDGMSGQVVKTGGNKIPQDRDYAKLTATENFITEQKTIVDNRSRKLKLAKAKSEAQKQRIRILLLDGPDDNDPAPKDPVIKTDLNIKEIPGVLKKRASKTAMVIDTEQGSMPKVGTVLMRSWGYEQTNIDFFKVTKIVGKMKFEGIELANDLTYGKSPDTGKVIPIDAEKGKEVTGSWKMKSYLGGKAYENIKIDGERVSRWDGKEKYVSWYAKHGMKIYDKGENKLPLVVNDDFSGAPTLFDNETSSVELKKPKLIRKTENMREIAITLKDAADAPKTKITNSHDVYDVFRSIWETNNLNVLEQSYVLFTDRSNTVVSYYPLSKGGIAGTVVEPEIIVALASKALATGVILAHNHPSNNLKPSEADIKITKQVKEALKLVRVELLDHLILTPTNGYYSFADEGIL